MEATPQENVLDPSCILRFGEEKDLVVVGASITDLIFEGEWKESEETLARLDVITKHCQNVVLLEVFVTSQVEAVVGLVQLLVREISSI